VPLLVVSAGDGHLVATATVEAGTLKIFEVESLV
jgi:hypothetical protein